jgi:hypothetical protein
VSPIFTLDTRTVSAGTLTGLVQGNGTPIANAQVRIDGTPFTTSTAANGTFTLTTVPAGSGYLLKVSAAGFASKPVPGIKVVTGTTDLGTIQLAPLGGPYRLLPLQPDVNPSVTQVEDGGVAYRYYRLVPVNQNDNPGGTVVSLRIAGGSTIPQAGATLDDWQGYQEDYWPGFQAGTADGDGTVRLRIPSSALGGPGASANLEVVESGTVKQTFTAQVAPRQYDQMWRHKVGYGAGGKLVILTAGGDVAYGAEVRHHFPQTSALSESITRSRERATQVGTEFGVGITEGPLSIKAGIGCYASGGSDQATTYLFSPASTDPDENAIKLYVALGDTLTLRLGPAEVFYDFVANQFSQECLSRLDSVEAGVRVGGDSYGNLDAKFTLGSSVNVGAWGDFTTETAGLVGMEQHYLSEQSLVRYVGFAVAATVSAGSPVGLPGGKRPGLWDFTAYNIGAETEVRGRAVTDLSGASIRRLELVQTVALDPNQVPPTGTGWEMYDTNSNWGREYTETLTDTQVDPNSISRLSAREPLWGAITGGGVGPVIFASQRAGLQR